MKAPLLKMTPERKQIHTKTKASAERYLREESALLNDLIEVEKSQTFKCFGYQYLTPYCRVKLNLSEHVAENFVRVVKKSIEVPELAAAITRGEIHLSNARTIASVITKENQAEWIKTASEHTKKDLEKKVAKAQGRDTTPLTLNLTHAERENFDRIQEVLCPILDKFPTKEEALSYILEKTLSKIDPLRKRDPSQDRSKVNARDQGKCQATYPDGTKCGEKKWAHHHHIIPREFGGPDSPENIITLCANHHRAIHREM